MEVDFKGRCKKKQKIENIFFTFSELSGKNGKMLYGDEIKIRFKKKIFFAQNC